LAYRNTLFLSTRARRNRAQSAAVAAADRGRPKPWRFLIFDGAARGRFGELLEQSLLKREPGARGQVQSRAQEGGARASHHRRRCRGQGRRENFAHRGDRRGGAAAQNLLVAAHALRYGGFRRTGAAAYDAIFRRELGLAESDAIVGFVCVGSVAGQGRRDGRETADAIRRLPS